MSVGISFGNLSISILWKSVLVLGLVVFFIFISFPNLPSQFPTPYFFSPLKKTVSTIHKNPSHPKTNLSHLVFGLLGSEGAWHYRKAYIGSWWRPNVTRGFLCLDNPPTGELVPWSETSPPYRVSADLSQFLNETNATAPIQIRVVHGIMEVFKEADDANMRWLVMGDDDSIFFVDNIVDVLSQYDHTKYYYIGGPSEFIMSNFWYKFNQGFGGAGLIFSYPLAKALSEDMENCLRRYSQLSSADLITMVCISDIGVNLSPHNGIHQIDLHGDLSGFLSSHPKSPLLSLHHLDNVEPIFPYMDRFEATRHLMKAADADQSRLLQQTICYHRNYNWSFSISWGYSVHIYEKIMPRSYLQMPIETFGKWAEVSTDPPFYMFNTRLPSKDPCEAPHVFFFGEVRNPIEGILTVYSRASSRGLGACSRVLNHSADVISEVYVLSSSIKRKEIDRCECCDIVGIDNGKAEITFRECMLNEIIA